jgi:uncharacterized protein (DUF2336 family)
MTAQSAELEQLVALAQVRTPEARGRIVNAMSELIVRKNMAPNSPIRLLAADILQRLIHDTELAVRQDLAKRLANEPTAPRELMITLANDQIEVARPILVESTALLDPDLIEVVHQRSLQHQLAVAMRRGVTEKVSAALVATGHDDVMVTLLNNPITRIARATYEYMVEQSRTRESLQEPLLRRQDLDADLAGRMYGWVSGALRQYIVQNFDVDAALIDRAMFDSLNEVIGDHVRAAALGGSADNLAEALKTGVARDPHLFEQLLRSGEVMLFEMLFAKASGLKITLARRVIYQPDGRALAVACRSAGLSRAVFTTLFTLIRQARAGDAPLDPTVLAEAQRVHDDTPEWAARDVLDRWRRKSSGDTRPWENSERLWRIQPWMPRRIQRSKKAKGETAEAVK